MQGKGNIASDLMDSAAVLVDCHNVALAFINVFSLFSKLNPESIVGNQKTAKVSSATKVLFHGFTPEVGVTSGVCSMP